MIARSLTIALAACLATGANAHISFASSPSKSIASTPSAVPSPSIPAYTNPATPTSKTKKHTKTSTQSHSSKAHSSKSHSSKSHSSKSHSSKSHSSNKSHAQSHSQASSLPASCGAFITTTSTASSTPSPTTITATTTTAIYINGDDGIVPCGSTTTFIYPVYQTYVTETVTFTQTSTSSSIIPPDSTSTVPAPSGFVPIQDSLPNAYYNNDGCANGPDPIDNACTISTSDGNQRRAAHRKSTSTCTITSTTTTILPSPTVTSTTTITKTYLAYPIEGTTYDYATCTQYTTYGTKTYATGTTTVYTYETTTTSITSQPTATATVYAACATANLANFVNPSPDGENHRIIYVTSNQNGRIAGYPGSPYECCVLALQSPTVRVWSYYPQGPGYGGECNLYDVPDGETCGLQGEHPYEIQVLNGTGIYPTVAGNAACGEFETTVVFNLAA